MTKYIFRLDDINPCMNKKNFERIMEIFMEYNIMPLIGIVPDNEDPKLCVTDEDPDFWGKMLNIQNKNLADLAMHGYNHLYTTKDQGILKNYGFKPQSEFAGIDYEVQAEKIQKGLERLKHFGLSTDIFMAPGHTFDLNTTKALADAGIKYITDGIGLYPYAVGPITLIPQQIGTPIRMPLGIITICLHFNSFSDNSFIKLKEFIEKNRANITTIREAQRIRPNFYHAILNHIFKIPYYMACKLKR